MFVKGKSRQEKSFLDVGKLFSFYINLCIVLLCFVCSMNKVTQQTTHSLYRLKLKDTENQVNKYRLQGMGHGEEQGWHVACLSQKISFITFPTQEKELEYVRPLILPFSCPFYNNTLLKRQCNIPTDLSDVSEFISQFHFSRRVISSAFSLRYTTGTFIMENSDLGCFECRSGGKMILYIYDNMSL